MDINMKNLLVNRSIESKDKYEHIRIDVDNYNDIIEFDLF